MLRLFSLLLLLGGGFFAVAAIYGQPTSERAQAAPPGAGHPEPLPATAALAPAVQRIVESVPMVASRPVILESRAIPETQIIPDTTAPNDALIGIVPVAGERRSRISSATSDGFSRQTDGFYRQVTVQRANVREGPSTRDAVVGRLSMGDEVAVLGGDGSGWLLIRVEGDGVEGWISARLLSE